MDLKHDQTAPHQLPSSGETTVDLVAKVDSERTAFFDPDDAEGAAAGRRGAAIEANVILIAHPEDKMLGQRYRLPPNGSLEIGRSSLSDISLPDVRSISRSHATLRHNGYAVEIEDLGSTNGTFVNDRPVERRQILRSGDRFQVGAVHFKFLHEQDPEHAYHEAIYQLVVCDGLTQSFNRRKFTEETARELERAKRHHRPLGLVLFDIDHFKKVNDTFGHLAGDHVLQQIARRTRDFLRTEQVFARVGGEEFAILNPEMDAEGTLTLAEKLRERIAGETFPYAGVDLAITCSFGVAELRPEMKTPDELYEAADRALYQSKNQGRNRVSRWEPET